MKVLEMGLQGYQVREWQQFLISKRLMPGGLPFGNFGPITQKATIAFQTQQGLKPDGKVGPKTIAQAKRAGFRPIGDNVTGIPSDTVDFSMKRHPQKEIQHGASAKHYTFAPGIDVPFSLEQKISRMADKYFALTGKGLHIFSGRRNAYRQADAMYRKFHDGDDVLKTYGYSSLAYEVKATYDGSVKAKKSKDETIKAMAETIQQQINRNAYISKHLLAIACDVDPTGVNGKTLQLAAATVGKVKVKHEKTPHHFHVQWEE
ncbi:MAG: peptidoglycan-binding protein [Blastocatellia bacterium]|nr:peptidoglycan-binding protein [Blastocatellia bacterium]